ncbi:unnamed protein product [Tuber melanosporum]|uniref:(Perigord truffle) hypothetical protein n=1 Tax=Tuber melanosporum (strain Mel28) TaxID=656061 RepID=D5G444_TUBMM|nr:uncharacterized protein GSTUM_00003943001 [Tuber melanosporum]CAZ79287.1 unnamed protein product [Tuber melanosporum]
MHHRRQKPKQGIDTMNAQKGDKDRQRENHCKRKKN